MSSIDQFQQGKERPRDEDISRSAYADRLLRRDGEKPLKLSGTNVLKFEINLFLRREIGKMNVAVFLSTEHEIILGIEFVPDTHLRLRKMYQAERLGVQRMTAVIFGSVENVMMNLSAVGVLQSDDVALPTANDMLGDESFETVKRLLN